MKNLVLAVLCSLFLPTLLMPPGVMAQPSASPQSENNSTNALIDSASFKWRSIKTPERNIIFFAEHFQTQGQLLAYWQTTYRPTQGKPKTLNYLKPTKKMELRFFPDATAQKTLPKFTDATHKKTRRIFLYQGRPNPNHQKSNFTNTGKKSEISALKKKSLLSKAFFQQKANYAVANVDLILADVYSVFDSGHRFVFARPARIKKNIFKDSLPPEAISDLDENEFLGKPWADYFFVKKNLIAYASPNSKSAAAFSLLEGETVELLATATSGWVLVKQHGLEKGTAPQQGYLRDNTLWLLD